MTVPIVLRVVGTRSTCLPALRVRPRQGSARRGRGWV